MSKDDQSVLAILTITQLIAQHGVPLALQILRAWEVDDPTPEDWRKLKVAHPLTFRHPTPP